MVWQPPQDEAIGSGGWQPPSDEAIQAQSPEEKPWYQKVSDVESSLGNKVSPLLKPLSDSMQGYAQSQVGSPSQLLQSVPSLFNKGADYLGEKTATSLASQGAKVGPLFSNSPRIKVSPTAAAAIGTGVAMAPDIAMSFANPEEGIASKIGGNEYAQNKALGAMGTPKRLLKDPQLVERAQGHAQTLLDEGLIKPFRGTQGMADELSNLESSSGGKIGEILDTLGEKGKVFDPQKSIQDINQLRPISKSTGQILRGGAYDKINEKIDSAIATIQAHLPQLPEGGTLNKPLTFQEANELKGVLQGLANYASNKDATLLDKVIAGKFRTSVDNSLEEAANQIGDPNLSQEFQKHKKIYGASQFAKDPIYNKLSSELTNKKISLTDWILGSASLATGNPLTAAAEVGLKKGIEKFGPSTQAYISNKLSKTPQLLGSTNKAYGVSKLLSPRSLDEKTALKYLDEAENDPEVKNGIKTVKEKAMELIQKDGY